jgi:hypothetical protein
MRIMGLMMLIAVAFTVAGEQPTPEPTPILPKTMVIHMKDSTSDSIVCTRLDLEAGITFDRFEMKIGVKDMVVPVLTDPPSYTYNTLHYCIGQIDSITFFQMPEGATAKRSVASRTSRQQAAAASPNWKTNPLFAAPKK